MYKRGGEGTLLLLRGRRSLLLSVEEKDKQKNRSCKLEGK